MAAPAEPAARPPRINLGSQGLVVSSQGLGCTGMSVPHAPTKPEHDMIALIRHAVSSGVTHFDTSDVYGLHTNETILGKALTEGVREKVEIATKFGFSMQAGQLEINGEPAYVREACERSLERLGVDCIDLYYQHQVDTRVPIEITIGELKKLVEEGKIKYIGLSEASASTIRRAHAVHPISAVQLEWSLWTRDVEIDIVPTCRELGIGIVAYSPLGRGFLSSGPKIVDNLSDQDYRKVTCLKIFFVCNLEGAVTYSHMFQSLPRFQPENLAKNAAIFDRMNEIASRKGCTPSQLALAWVHHRGSDVCPIPGTTKIKNFDENLGALFVKLTTEEMDELESCCAAEGDRCSSFMPTWRNSETPHLHSWKGE